MPPLLLTGLLTREMVQFYLLDGAKNDCSVRQGLCSLHGGEAQHPVTCTLGVGRRLGQRHPGSPLVCGMTLLVHPIHPTSLE